MKIVIYVCVCTEREGVGKHAGRYQKGSPPGNVKQAEFVI